MAQQGSWQGWLAVGDAHRRATHCRCGTPGRHETALNPFSNLLKNAHHVRC